MKHVSSPVWLFYGITRVHVYWMYAKFQSFQSNDIIKSTMRRRNVYYDKKKKDKSSESTEDEICDLLD
jgi:hypothetical protein